MIHTFVFMGRPGAGKGTQAKRLAEARGFALFSAGEKIRSLAKEGTPLGQKIKAESEAGHLIPHWFASLLFEQELLSCRSDEGIIFDGMCRKLPEAKLFEEVTGWLERPFRVLYLNVREKEIMRRLEKRLNAHGRKDDTVESLTKRLEEFRNETEPALAYLREQGHVIDIPGEGEPDAIFKEIQERIAGL